MPETQTKSFEEALDLIFRVARTHYAWTDQPVEAAVLKEVYELAKLGPTSLNSQPLRILFLTTEDAKSRLLPALMPGNVEKTRTAPVVALFAYDTAFYEHLPRLIPHYDVKAMFESNADLTQKTGVVNSTLQAAYFLLAARALGLDCGPMAGFNPEAVNKEFFPDGKWAINFISNLGYGSGEGQHPRLPRLDFEEATSTI